MFLRPRWPPCYRRATSCIACWDRSPEELPTSFPLRVPGLPDDALLPSSEDALRSLNTFVLIRDPRLGSALPALPSTANQRGLRGFSWSGSSQEQKSSWKMWLFTYESLSPSPFLSPFAWSPTPLLQKGLLCTVSLLPELPV